MQDTTLYFAYGSNLNAEDWRRFCDAHGADPGGLNPQRVAWLPDHRLVFHYFSKGRGGGALDVEPSTGDAVPGLLCAPDAATWALLDAKEGAPRRYKRTPVTLLTPEGRALRAWTYQVTQAHRQDRFIPPTDAYRDICRQGLWSRGLPCGALTAACDGATSPPRRPWPSSLFVYGTLMRGGRLHHHIQQARPSQITAARCAGRLYRVGWYPGLRPAVHEHDVVHGERVEVDSPAAALRALDDVEDFRGYDDDSASLYHRIIGELHDEDGAAHHGWLYLYVGSVSPDAHLPSGRWSCELEVTT